MIPIDSSNDISVVRNKKLFILDLDGTIYIENRLIDGAREFVENAQKNGAQVLFLTNNSSLSTDDYVKKIGSLGFTITAQNILTSGFAAGVYLQEKNKRNVRIYVVGTAALKQELAALGHVICDEADNQVDVVLAGFDTELTYGKIRAACTYIERGAEFVATNPDLVCPVADKKFIPDCGSIYKMIQNATGREPFVVGKPGSVMAQIVRNRFSTSFSEMVMIGDRLYTDVAFGLNSGILSICVLTGESSLQTIETSPWKPHLVLSSINFLNNLYR